LRNPVVRSLAVVRLPQFGQMNRWAMQFGRVARRLKE
jgi:hypothetical protein